jgi:hypothetical protein
MKYILFFFISLVSINCYLSILPKQTREIIPPDANKIILSFDMPADSLFLLVNDFLMYQNYRILTSNQELAYIYTDGKYVGQSLNMRLNIQITGNGENSKLNCKAEWILDPTVDEAPAWRESTMLLGGFFRLSYEKMVLDLQKLPYKEIQFVKDQFIVSYPVRQ